MNYSMIPVFLLSVMLIIMLMRIMLPIGAKIKGKGIKELKLSFQERVLLQHINIYAVGFVLLICILGGVLSRNWELLVMAAVVLLLLMRVRYIFTDDGIALNNVVYRDWHDFTGYEIRRRSVRLIPREGYRPFDVVVLGRHRELAISVIRTHLREIPATQTARKAEGKGLQLWFKRLIRRSAVNSHE